MDEDEYEDTLRHPPPPKGRSNGTIRQREGCWNNWLSLVIDYDSKKTRRKSDWDGKFVSISLLLFFFFIREMKIRIMTSNFPFSGLVWGQQFSARFGATAFYSFSMPCHSIRSIQLLLMNDDDEEIPKKITKNLSSWLRNQKLNERNKSSFQIVFSLLKDSCLTLLKNLWWIS